MWKGSFATLCTLLAALVRNAHAATPDVGGELAAFDDEPYRVDRVAWSEEREFRRANRHRQDLCGRYAQVLDRNITWRDALRGLELRPLIRAGGKYFTYSNETGIPADLQDAGLMATLLDELGARAGFTWRTSFGVTYGPPPNMTFTELLLWSVEQYDISVNWWDETLERMEGGASFIRPFFDGSLVLIEKQIPPQVDRESINYFNWLRPFTTNVWWMTLFTIVTSALTYQWIEHLASERDGRSMWHWFSDNLYLSAINFPQNYEFSPTHTAGRVFGVSMSFWALVMAASYTANLASLLVDEKKEGLVVESMEDVVRARAPVCTYANTGLDTHIRTKYRQVTRVPLPSELETYQGLQNGQCKFTVGYYQNWLGHQRNRSYNPECDLAWVGRTVKTIKSGFAVKADAGDLCTSMIREVLNIYIDELIADDYLDELWDAEYSKTQDIDCDAPDPFAVGTSSDQRALRQEQPVPARKLGQFAHPPNQQEQEQAQEGSKQGHRTLKGRGAAASVGGSSEEGEGGGEDQRLTVNQMAGTFVLHYVVCALAILIAYIKRYLKSSPRKVHQSLADLSRRMRSKNFTRNGTSTELDYGDETENPGPLDQHSISDYNSSQYYGTPPSSEKDFQEEEEEHDEDAADDFGPTSEGWKATQKELNETKNELKHTRKQMESILSMLTKLHMHGKQA